MTIGRMSIPRCSARKNAPLWNLFILPSGEFAKLKSEIETPAYFKEQLFYNYIYKGPVLEWYMRVKVKLEKNYKLFDEMVPDEGKVLDIGCGYGFLSYMLHFVKPKRQVTGLDYDEQKIATANHCFSKDESVRFVYANVMEFNFDTYDAIILSDILHYLQPDEQKLIVEKCIAHLTPGGKIIIRDGNKDLEKRHKGTKLTELFSTRIMAFNKTSVNGLSFLSGNLIEQIARDKKNGL